MGDLNTLIELSTIVDLSHEFYPGIPHAEDMPNEESRLLYNFDPDGFRAHIYEFAGQWGTHIDPPVHFVEGGRSLEQINTRELILPLVVIDCVDECKNNSDYLLDQGKIETHEKKYGTITPGCFVAMRSGWSSRWPDAKKMANKDGNGVAHFPGWGLDAARFLIEQRNVSAFGHETTDTDGGIKISNDDFGCEEYILRKDLYQIEILASMAGVPCTGSLIFVGFAKPRGGSGFPVRALALVPKI